MKWFWQKEPPQPRFFVVEVPKPLAVAETPATAAEVASLRSHSGFQFLLRKLDYQAARLRAELAQNKHETIRDVEFLQSGIHWCDWLRQQLDFAHEKYLNTREATEQELKFFQDISSQIELIGRPQDPQ